jgi:hypothetical protein
MFDINHKGIQRIPNKKRNRSRPSGHTISRPTVHSRHFLHGTRHCSASSANAVAECGSRVIDEVELTHANPIRDDDDTDGNYMPRRRSSGPP